MYVHHCARQVPLSDVNLLPLFAAAEISPESSPIDACKLMDAPKRMYMPCWSKYPVPSGLLVLGAPPALLQHSSRSLGAPWRPGRCRQFPLPSRCCRRLSTKSLLVDTSNAEMLAGNRGGREGTTIVDQQ